MMEFWRRLAIDPATGLISTNFLLAVVPSVLAILGGGVVALSKRVRTSFATQWNKRIATRLGATSRGWERPSVEVLKRESRLLIIDDENLAHFEQLQLRHFTVAHWKSVDQARAEHIDRDYDALILDVRGVQDAFGAKDGLDAINLIRRDNPWVPIMINTAYLGAMSEERRKLVKELSQKSLAKVIRYHDFEEQVVDLLYQGRSRDYFVALLKRLSVKDPPSTITLLESAPAANPKWSFEQGTKDAPFQRDQVESVLSLARAMITGARWKSRRS